MTIICGLHRDKRIVIGTDSRTVFGSQIFDHGDKAIVSDDQGCVLACTGPARLRHLAQSLDLNDPSMRDPFGVSERLQTVVQNDGWRAQDTAGEGPCFHLGALLATYDGLWAIGADFTVYAIPPGVFWADGNGGDIALGAGDVLMADATLSVESLIAQAIEAAITHCNACGGPVKLYTIEVE